jgi:hypothetical protein
MPHQPISPSVVNSFDVILLEKKNPLLGAIWSALSPGLGQLYGGATIVGAFVLAWWIFVTYKAKTIGAWFHSFIGNFSTGSELMDWQWFLFLPSMYCFSIYQAYTAVTANNVLYDIEQIRFLRVRDEIDSIHRADGRSVLDGAMVSATIFMLLGTIYGFVLHWGPIIWALIELVSGFFLGLSLEVLFQKKKIKLFARLKSEVFMQVTCNTAMKDNLIKVLKERKATGYLIIPQ